MFEFEKLCKMIEDMDAQTFGELLAEKSQEIILALSVLTLDGLSALQIYMNFILCSIAADGKLSEEEYMAIKPGFELLAKKEVSYEDAVAVFKAAGLDKSKDYKKVVNDMVDVLGMVSLDLKEAIILVCMMVCSVDGKISLKEKRWIKQLIR